MSSRYRSLRQAAASKARAAAGRIGRGLAEASPGRLLLLICVTIGVTHALTMFAMRRYAGEPALTLSLVRSALLILALFPALYFFFFRPLIVQVAERRQAEATMRESEHKYRHLFESLGDAAFLIDVPTGRVIDANRQAEKLLGSPRADILGRPFDLWMPPARPDGGPPGFGPGSPEEGTGFEGEVLAKDGRRVPVHVSTAPLVLFGHDLVVGLFRDVTAFKTLHAELLRAQRLESVGALASGVAHDINNALTPILFATELLRVKQPGTDDRHLLDTIRGGAARATQIVRQMLSFVRGGEGGRADIEPRHLVREAADMAAVAFPKSIRISQQLPKTLWTVRADSAQLSQILMNLAVNARDAMPDGGELRFSAGNFEVSADEPRAAEGLKPGFYVLLSVADTGCGIPPDLKDRIFEPFFTTKPVGKGTGLGLATVRDIVADHGGVIHVVSQPGHGADFRIFLPANPNLSAAPADEGGKPAPKGSGELVLVADDEASILEMTRLGLESGGYRVLQARNGAEAVALAAEHRGDLKIAIVDTMMPILGGAATLVALQKIDPSLKVVRTSGSVDASGAEPAQPDEQPFLRKPYSANQLLEALHAMLEA